MVIDLRSIASFTSRSVSWRIACFDISRFLAFWTIGHTAASHGNELVGSPSCMTRPQPTPIRGSTKPRRHLLSSKIRDVDFTLDCVPTGTADRTTASTVN
jgi:hypothetical protein